MKKKPCYDRSEPQSVVVHRNINPIGGGKERSKRLRWVSNSAAWAQMRFVICRRCNAMSDRKQQGLLCYQAGGVALPKTACKRRGHRSSPLDTAY